MLNQYKPLIQSVQAKYFTLDKDDSYSACIEGYYTAMLRYVDERLYMRENYHLARHLNYYMRSACQKEARNDRTIHIPHNKLIDLKKAQEDKLFERDIADLSDSELELRHDLETTVIPAIMSPSMDTPIGEDTTIADVIPTKADSEIVEDESASERMKMLVRNLNRLNNVEKVAVIMNLGLCGFEESSLREIGAKIGCSHTKAGQHLKSGLNNLKIAMFENERLSAYTKADGKDWDIPVLTPLQIG